MTILKNSNIPLWLFDSILILLFCFSIVLIEFKGVPISGFYSFATTSLQFVIVSFCTAGLLLLLSSNRWIFSVLFPPILVICSVICFYNITIGTRLTPVAIELALVNDASMWWTMISPLLIAVIVVSLLLGCMISYIRLRCVKTTRRARCLCAFIGLVIVLIPTCIVKRIQAPVCSRLPYSLYYSFKEYVDNRHAVSENRDTYINTVVESDENAPDVVLVLGESLRADHLPMNGYERNTMPRVSRDSSVINFSRLYSEFTYTYTSVPHLLTQRSDDSDYAYNEQSFITLFKKGGYKTSWFANQELSNSYAYFAHEADTLYYVNADRSLYSYDKWLDTDILPLFSEWYDIKTAGGPRFAVIHTIGSHWWYRSHYTDEHALFTPEISHKDIGGLSKQELVNSYDNTIIATDEFLHEVFRKLENENVIVLFVSDHGEALGEDGLFLHATDTDILHYPAMFVWYSEKYRDIFPEVIDELESIKDKDLDTGAIFDIVLYISRLKIEW